MKRIIYKRTMLSISFFKNLLISDSIYFADIAYRGFLFFLSIKKIALAMHAT